MHVVARGKQWEILALPSVSWPCLNGSTCGQHRFHCTYLEQQAKYGFSFIIFFSERVLNSFCGFIIN